MTRLHAILISTIVAVAIVIGGVALARSTADRPVPAGSTPKSLAARSAALDALEASIQEQLRTAPPARAAQTEVRVTASPAHDDEDEDDWGDDDDDWEGDDD